MRAPPTLQNEIERLAALRRFGILDTLPEVDFDSLTTFVASVCATPMAAITLVDANRQWFKSSIGWTTKETARDVGFCAHAIADAAAPLIIPDATIDERFADNPLVTGNPGIRFYAGMPIVSPDGYALGAICVLDREPRELTELQIDALAVAARLIMTLIEHHAGTAQLGLAAQAKHAVEQEHRAVTKYLTTVEVERVRVANELRAETARRARFQNELVYSQTHDALTTLPNRSQFMKSLEAAFRALAEGSGQPRSFAVYMIDIDHCKQINDTLGNKAGDSLLVQCGERLLDVARLDDVVARFDSDTFSIIAFGASTVEAATSIALKVRAAFAVPWRLAEIDCVVTASVGVAVADGRHTDGEHIVRDADIAMHHSKREGGDRHSFFQASLGALFQSKIDIDRALALALANDEFKLAYQPIVSLAPGQMQLEGFEALLRWQRPDGVWVPPAAFIIAAEESGLIVPLGAWAMKTACRTLRHWRGAARLSARPVQMSVNVSAIQLGGSGFASAVREVLRAADIDPHELVIEITESAAMQNAERSLRALRTLRELGVGIHLDDFGTGYSSLSYLRRLPVTRVKIDRSFVSATGCDGLVDPVIVRAIISLAHELDVKVIAEGVETLTQWDALRDLGCDSVQGYFISHPLPAHEAATFMERLDLRQPSQIGAAHVRGGSLRIERRREEKALPEVTAEPSEPAQLFDGLDSFGDDDEVQFVR